MKILLIGATQFEIQPTLDYLQKNSSKVHSCEISFLITGVGAVALAYSLSKNIFETRPQIILQAGIAGCFPGHSICDTVIVGEDCFADLGVKEDKDFKTIFDLHLAGLNDFPFRDGKLQNPYKKLMGLSALKQVTGITVNEISTEKEKIIGYQETYNASVETMEGAAFHYVCLQEKIPFLQIRSISNKIGERDKTKWELKKSIDALNNELIFLIEKIAEQNETYFRI